MKKPFFVVALMFCILSACHNPFHSTPVVPPNGGGGQTDSPVGLSATQGEKRTISLSWVENTKATLYYIYRADSPLNAFVRCGETESTRITFNVQPGSTVYYRVTSVFPNGAESRQSAYVKGTSLAQPVISDITDINESSAAVTWYMENVTDDTYKNNLLYTVYCFNGDTEVAQVALDGADLSENKAVFTDLNANTLYEYQVEAYLRSDQNAAEISDRMDAATARRFRPGPPLELIASHGTAKDRITLSFILPEMVDIALGDNQYDPKPLYFVISRRLYSETLDNEYSIVSSYFGSVATNPLVNSDDNLFGKFNDFDVYLPGAEIKWVDTTAISRGVKYEYIVQSYVDTNKIITSDMSKTNTIGWALSEGTLAFGKVEYQRHPEKDEYEHAWLNLEFNFDSHDEVYNYLLKETIKPVGDDNIYGFDPDTDISRSVSFDTYEAICAHVPEMDMTQKTTEQTSGRGLYSYAIEIRMGEDVLDTISARGQIEISESTRPIVVESFRVQDGYTDKFVLLWINYANRKYVIEMTANEDDELSWAEVGVVNPTPNEDDTTVNGNFAYTVSSQTPGLTMYFRIQPFRDLGGGSFRPGQYVYAPAASYTLGIPELSEINDRSYSTITAVWKEAQKADTYRIKYRYTDESEYKTAATMDKNNIVIDSLGEFKFPFKPDGYNDVTQSGKEIQIQIEALNETLRKNVGGDEIATTSDKDVRTRLIGPALIGLSASQAASAAEIEISWNKIEGADGYYVFRRQFNMNNTAEERDDTEESGGVVVYYVPASDSSVIEITGKNLLVISGQKTDSTTVQAEASFESLRYTLKDRNMPDTDYDVKFGAHAPAYRNQQNELAWGYPYRYYVVPVLADEPLASIEFDYAKDSANKNTAILSYTIQENDANVVYSGAADLEKEGFTIGFGMEVTASKGTKSRTGEVVITWKAPPLLEKIGFNQRYVVFRKRNSKSEAGSADTTWRPVTDGIADITFTDTPQERGIAYDYAVGIYPESDDANTVLPPISARFIRTAKERYTDEKDRPKMIGFTLAPVSMIKVSRSQFDDEGVELKDSEGNFGELVEWYAGGIDGADSYKGLLYDNNWGIDGYEVYVMNRNIDTDWHLIADIADLPNNVNQNALVNNVQGGNTLEGGLLKVMRDYRHYFKVRSYVLDEFDEKILCPDPPFTFAHWFSPSGSIDTSNGSRPSDDNNDYIKWGARQISAVEFFNIATLYMARGLQVRLGNDWTTNWAYWRESDSSGHYGASGKVRSQSNFLVTNWDIEFVNWKNDLQTRAGYDAGRDEWVTFITVQGNLWIESAASLFPVRYGDAGWIDINGPADTPALYTGRIRIGGDNDDLYWDNGRVCIIYPSANMEDWFKKPASGGAKPADEPWCERISYRGEDTPLHYTGQGNERYQQDTWR